MKTSESYVMQANPRIPANEYEVFAMAWTLGYLGLVPSELRSVFPGENFDSCPEFIPDTLAHLWRQGYDSGLAFFCDHALDGEG